MRIFCLFVTLLLASCASQPPQTTSYLLRSQLAATPGTPVVDSGIALGNVLVADYIDQPGLVMANADGTIHAARYHVWAEPLRISLRRYLASQLSEASGRDISISSTAATTVAIDVSVDQMHGTGDGSAVLVAYWRIDSSGNDKSYRFSEREALSGDGYEVLVRAQEALLKRLAQAIVATLPAAGTTTG